MADKKKSHKVLKIIGLALLLIIVIAVVLVGFDYKSYKGRDRSHLFGTLYNYTQNQTLKFGSLNLKVTSVTLSPYPNPGPAPPPCIKTWGCGCGYQNSLNQYQSSNILKVSYQYSNVSNHPLDMSAYVFRLIGNTPLNNNGGCDIPSGAILKSSPLIGCISNDISNTYHGPLSLVVTSGNKEKTITINLPT